MLRIVGSLLLVGAFALGWHLGGNNAESIISPVTAANADRVFEIRTYTSPDGKLDDLHRRFRDHTLQIFERHGMTNVGYWVPSDGEESSNTLIYILAYPSRQAAESSWTAFRQDPEWRRVVEESTAAGPIMERAVSTFLDPTDYSPLR